MILREKYNKLLLLGTTAVLPVHDAPESVFEQQQRHFHPTHGDLKRRKAAFLKLEA